MSKTTKEQIKRAEAVTLMMETSAVFYGGTLLKATVDNPKETARVRKMMCKVYDALYAKGIITERKLLQ